MASDDKTSWHRVTRIYIKQGTKEIRIRNEKCCLGEQTLMNNLHVHTNLKFKKLNANENVFNDKRKPLTIQIYVD